MPVNVFSRQETEDSVERMDSPDNNVVGIGIKARVVRSVIRNKVIRLDDNDDAERGEVINRSPDQP